MKALLLLTVALAFALVATVTFARPAGEDDDTAMAAEKEMVLDPTTGEMVSAPQYGGTITWAARNQAPNSDPWHVGGWAPHFISGVNEALGFTDWATSRDTFNFAFWASSTARDH